MPTTFRPYEPDRLLPLAPDMREWLPEGHLAHHASDRRGRNGPRSRLGSAGIGLHLGRRAPGRQVRSGRTRRGDRCRHPVRRARSLAPKARDDHAQYIGAWLEQLDDDPKAGVEAAGHASAAVRYITECMRIRRAEREAVRGQSWSEAGAAAPVLPPVPIPAMPTGGSGGQLTLGLRPRGEPPSGPKGPEGGAAMRIGKGRLSCRA